MKTKLTALFLATVMLITPIAMNPTASYAGTKATTVKTTNKVDNSAIVKSQLDRMYDYLDKISEWDSMVLEAYLYDEIGEGTYEELKDILDVARGHIKDAINMLKKNKTPLTKEHYDKLAEYLDILIDIFEEN